MKRLNVTRSVSLAMIAVLPFATHGGTISISTDFDHSGSGSLYTISVSSVSGSRRVTWSNPSSTCCSAPSPQFVQEVHDYEADRLEEQLRIEEARRAVEAEQRAQQAARERADRADRADRGLRAIDQLDRMLGVEADEVRRYQLKYQLTQLIPELNSGLNKYRSTRTSRIEQLALSIDKIVVPSPLTHYGTVMIFGTGVSPQQAAESPVYDPFDARPYDRVVALGQPGFLADLPRAALDHLLASFDLLSRADMRRIEGLRGASIDKLVAHSNGALVAEVLIRRGIIRVRELDLLGGDGALMSLDALADLHDKTGVQINVYATKDDPVPLLPLGWKIRALAEKLREILPSMRNSSDDTHAVLGLTSPSSRTLPAVNVHLLSTQYSSERVQENHGYMTYYAIIRAQALLSRR